MQEDLQGPLIGEVKHVLDIIKKQKAAGTDNFIVEKILANGEIRLTKVTNLLNTLYYHEQ